MTTKNYNLPNPVPFTTAQSDFEKLITVGADYENKKSLIDYAATDFGTLREGLINYLKAVYPTDYQNITEGDFGIMFAELVAYMGSIMSFKADALANENFLATAKNRKNVKKLLDLIGIRMKGPTSAGANAILTLDSSYGSDFTIPASNRIFTITSPQDGGQLTFTLYKTINGSLEKLTSNTAGLEMLNSESSDGGTTWNNLALVEGAMISEAGSFTSTEVFKVIPLTQGPVAENSVQVFIESNAALSGAYTQVDNIFGASGSTDKIFDVLTDDLYNGTVRFGDGVVGASPPNGATYRVLYRVGGGSRGNILGTVLNSPINTGDGGTGTIATTSIAAGGQDAETVAHAKRYGPLVFKQQDRLVTLGDYQSFVSRYYSPTGGTAIATAATRKAYSSANVIDVYVLQQATDNQLQKATVEYKTNLLSEIEKRKMLTDEVVVVDGLIRTLDLVVTLYADKAYIDLESKLKGAALQTILNFFSFDRFTFGQPFIPQDLNRDLYEVDQVRFSTIDNIDENLLVDFNEVIQLNNVTINLSFI